jgi:hypothetical protein
VVSANTYSSSDLHSLDDLERYINILMGEVAERMVADWITMQGKYCESDSTKGTGEPDAGHDLILRKPNYDEIRCSIKSSLTYKLDIPGILRQCKLATKPSELREVNIQVYYWLTLNPERGKSRVTVPAIRQSCIIGWFAHKDIKQFTQYNHENRQVPEVPLNQARPMHELLNYII